MTLPFSSKIRNKTLTLFIALAIVGVLLNFGFDYHAFREAQKSDLVGQRLQKEYEATLKLQKVDQAVSLLLVPPNTPEEIGNTKKAIAEARRLLQDPRQIELLQKLDVQIKKTKIDPMSTMKNVSDLLALQAGLLEESRRVDWLENSELENAFVHALVLDTLFIFALFTLFFIYLKSRRKIERNLSLSIKALRDANINLQEELVKRQMSMKTTVHDLRNPLGSIQLFAEMISDDVVTEATVQEFSETIQRISQKSLALVDSLLAKPNDSVFDLKPVDLIGCINEICTQNEILALQKKQQIFLDISIPSAPVSGNKMRLEELLANLISNAIKYSPLGGKIWVRCLSKQDTIIVEIEDQGPGFNKEDMNKAFHYGQTLTAKPTGNESSTGFGLFMAKQIVELHKGTIEIKKAVSGFGACVCFSIPKN